LARFWKGGAEDRARNRKAAPGLNHPCDNVVITPLLNGSCNRHRRSRRCGQERHRAPPAPGSSPAASADSTASKPSSARPPPSSARSQIERIQIEPDQSSPMAPNRPHSLPSTSRRRAIEELFWCALRR
jgi:hypothetical protein